MSELTSMIEEYLTCCREQKNLSGKTLKAYAIDLTQYADFQADKEKPLEREQVLRYISHLHQEYKPRSMKRKAASLKAFCGYLNAEERLEANPFDKIRLKIQEPLLLPRTIPFAVLQDIFSCAYEEMRGAATEAQRAAALRNTAALELLFAAGLRVSELCGLRAEDIDFGGRSVRIFGKGSKERILQIENSEVLSALEEYRQEFQNRMEETGYFFVGRNGRFSEQAVRYLVRRLAEKAGSRLHITPHMFRHSFATLLLEEDVDIRYIQQLLGHSSITTTQIYTHVTSNKQRLILTEKHPRNRMAVKSRD